MEELENNLSLILQEKQEKIIPENIKQGIIIFGVEGTFEAEETLDTSDATAKAEDLLLDKTAYVNGEKVTGTMPNNETLYYTPKKDNQNIPAGYTSGGTVWGDTNLKAENIKKDVSIFNVIGTYEEKGIDTSDADVEAKDILAGKTAYAKDEKITGTMVNHGARTITPSQVNQLIEEGYVTQVMVLGDSNLLPENIKLGTTIFGIEGTLDKDFDTSAATATADDILYGKTAYLADGELATGTITSGSSYGHKFREVGHNANQSYISFYPSKGYYNGTTNTGAIYVPLRSRWSSATEEDKRFINELFAEFGITPEIMKKGISLYGISGTFTADADATAADIKAGKTAYVNGEKIEGIMEAEEPVDNITLNATSAVVKAETPDKLTVTALSNVNGVINEETDITVQAESSQVASAIGLAPDLIKSGTNILGIEGTYGSEASEFNGKLEIPESVPANFTIVGAIKSISELNTSSLTNGVKLFDNCYSLQSLPDMTTSNFTNAMSMCSNCYNLVHTPLLDFSKCTSVAYAFGNCQNLAKANIIMPTVQTSVNGMFMNCSSLTELPAFDYRKINNSSGYAGGLTNYCYNCSNLVSVDLGGIYTYARYGHSFQTAFYNCTNLKTFRGLNHIAVQTGYPASYISTFQNCYNLTTVKDFHMYVPTLTSTFENCYNLTTFENCRVTGMDYNGINAAATFRNCYNLLHTPFYGPISLAQNAISSVFANCKSITFENALSFNFANSRYSNYSALMFENCLNIENIHIKGILRSNYGHHAYRWFYNCENLRTATIENFPASMNYWFEGCTNLQYVDLIGDTPSACVNFLAKSGVSDITNSVLINSELPQERILPNGYYMDCYNLTTAGNMVFNAYYVCNCFMNCYNLADLENISFYNVLQCINMFMNCTNLAALRHIKSFATNASPIITNMVAGCTNLNYMQSLNMKLYNGYGGFIAPFGNYTQILSATLPPLNNLVHFEGFANLGEGYTITSANNIYASPDIVGAPNLSYESLLNITTNLANLYVTYNIAEGSTLAYPQLIYMEANQYNKLSETDIADLQAKGWNISVQTITE